MSNGFINDANATGLPEVRAHNAAMERAMAPMMKMLHDHKLCLSNPERFFPLAYVTETASNETRYRNVNNTHTTTESSINNDNMIITNNGKT